MGRYFSILINLFANSKMLCIISLMCKYQWANVGHMKISVRRMADIGCAPLLLSMIVIGIILHINSILASEIF